jgi:small subunit ribosomal protein S8
MLTDPIADMLTRIRNAVAIERPYVEIPSSIAKAGIAQALVREGYIWDVEVIAQKPRDVLRLNLKYGPNGEKVIQEISRVSSPGRRVYRKSRDLPVVLGGMGIAVVSTSRGILSSREAKAQNLGGEVLCSIW